MKIDQKLANALAALNPRQAKFAHEFAANGNGKQAAIAAGYAPRSAEYTGSTLQRNPKVAPVIAMLREEHAKKEIFAVEERQRILRDIANDPDEGGQARVRAIHEMNRMTGDHAEIRVRSTTLNVDVAVQYEIAMPERRGKVIEHDDE